MTKQKKADLLLVLVTVCWGTSYYLTDICLAEMPPMCLNAFRFLLSFVTLGIVFHKSLRKLDRKTLKYSCYVGLALAGSYICFVYGISRTSLSNAAFICALPVLFTPLLDFLVNRTKLSRKLLGCLVLCVCGLGLLTLRDTLMPTSGDVISLGVPICYAVDLLLTEKAVKSAGVNALNLGVCQLGVVGIITLIRLDIIEKFGTGIMRIKKAYSDIKHQPIFEVKDNSVLTILPTINMRDSLTKDQQQIIGCLENGMVMASSQISQITGFGKDKTVNLLKKLQKKNYVEKTGVGRGTRYRLV